MDLLWLRIVICIVVVAVLTFYLYDAGAWRVYDIGISIVVIIVTSLLFAALAVICKIKNGKVFDETNGLEFTSPKNILGKLPFFLLVFVGKRNIMPKSLRSVDKTEMKESE